MPAAIIIDQAGSVRFADVSPDWLVRTEPDDIIAAVQAITARRCLTSRPAQRTDRRL